MGVAISDVVTGLFGAIGLLGALLGREGRAGSAGSGSTSRCSRSTLAVLVNQAHNAFATGHAPGRLGNAHPNIVPYETFATSDGEVAVAVGSEKQWPRLCEVLGVAALATDPRFTTNDGRVRTAKRCARCSRRLRGGDIGRVARGAGRGRGPCGADHRHPGGVRRPPGAGPAMTVEVEHPAYGVLRQVGLPIELSATPASIRSAPPMLGEHATEILRELGYDESRIERLRAGGVI